MIAVIGAVLIVAIMLFTPWGSNIFIQATDNYGTGVTIDTKAKNAIISGESSAITNYPYIVTKNTLNHADLGEIMDSSRYILSWQPGEKSTSITARVSADWVVKYDKLISINYLFGDYPQTLIQSDYWWDVTLTDASGATTQLIDGKNFTGGPIGEPNNDVSIKKDWVYIQSGYPRRVFPGLTDCSWAILNKGAAEKWYSKGSAGTWPLETETLVFQIKGNHIGYLTVKCYLQNSAYSLKDEGIPGFGIRTVRLTGPVLLSEDKAYLASGLGSVVVDSVNSIKSVGSDTAEGTGIVYTKYVWAEGQNVTFNVKTGYSGTSLEADQQAAGDKGGWYLKISNSKGDILKTGAISRYVGGIWQTDSLSKYTGGMIPLADGLTNYKIRYQVPKGAFIPNDPNDNEWMVTLSNTLFDQSETRLFVVDSLEKIPGKSTATFDKDHYKQWETCKLTLTAKGNPAGANDVNHFRVWVNYDGWTSTNYALTARSIPAIKSGDTYTATVTFQVALGDKNLYATTVAIDSQGRAGPEGEDMAYVEQVIPNPNPNPFPSLPSGGDMWLIIILIGVVVAGGVATYFMLKRKGGSKPSFKKPNFKLPKWGKKK